MRIRSILISLVIIICTTTDIFADKIAHLTPPLSLLPQGEETSNNLTELPSSLSGDVSCEYQFNPEAYYEDAISQYKDGNPNGALEKFRFLADNRLEINDPEITGPSLYMTGHIMSELGLEGAALYYEQIISVYPLLIDYALFRLAESEERKDNPAEAAKLYTRVYDSYPDSGLQKKALLRASRNFQLTGNTKDARAGFKTFLDIYSKDTAVPEALYNIGISYLREGRESDAQNFFQKIWIDYPLSREARLVKTMVHLPLSADNIFRRGSSFYDKGYYKEAIDEYKSVLSKKKGVSKAVRKEAAFKIGMSYYRLRMSGEAETNLELFLTKYPHDKMAPDAAYWLGRTYLRLGKENAYISSSKEFLKQYKKDERYPEVLFRLANICAERNDIKNAVFYFDRVISEYPLNSFAADSTWKKGWISYKTGNKEGALQTFNTIINSPGEHPYKAQALYWRAKLLGKNGDYEAMNKDLCRLCSNHGQSFYCLFSKYYFNVNRNDEKQACQPEHRAELESASSSVSQIIQVRDDRGISFSRDSISNNPEEQGLKRIRLFLYLGLKDDAKTEVLKLRSRMNDNKETSLMLANILSSLGEYNRAMYTIRPYIPSLKSDNVDGSDNSLWPLVYPAGYSDLITKHAIRSNLDPFLVYAIIREESWFNKEAVSPAGALGLMQLMPGTAKRVAKDSYAGRESLFDPETNIELGTKFFSERLRQFDGNIFLAIASYNAGPEAVEQWMNELSGVELDEFIEDIPYKETREYVKKVFRSYMEYNRLYKEEMRIDTL
ncbi:MAG: tetratricopeptide repeat protein [Nitrospirae bacterium]|nr:tetratricopeptide repeat protein [Nitrospirota bacterium]